MGFLQKYLSCFILVCHVIWQITDFSYEPFKSQGTFELEKPQMCEAVCFLLVFFFLNASN